LKELREEQMKEKEIEARIQGIYLHRPDYNFYYIYLFSLTDECVSFLKV